MMFKFCVIGDICYEYIRIEGEGSNEEISEGTYHEQLSRGRLHTVVPFRNGLFLSSAVSLILGQYPDDDLVVYLGNHAGDVENHEYADCSIEFTEAMSKAVYFGTDGKVTFFSPFEGKKKSDVVKCGLSMGVPFELTWSCYHGKDKPCKKCPTCIQRLQAFRDNGVRDPTW
jgi:7-cyano-7-deazaguanine synthase